MRRMSSLEASSGLQSHNTTCRSVKQGRRNSVVETVGEGPTSLTGLENRPGEYQGIFQPREGYQSLQQQNTTASCPGSYPLVSLDFKSHLQVGQRIYQDDTGVGYTTMRESMETCTESESQLCRPSEHGMHLTQSSDEDSQPAENNNKCLQQDKLHEAAGALSKHRDRLGTGLPSETSKLLKDILQHKDRRLRDNNNSLKALMVNGEGKDSSDLIAQLLKNNSSFNTSPMMDDRDGSSRLAAVADSESDSDQESYSGRCQFTGEEDIAEIEAMEGDMKDSSGDERRWGSDSYDVVGQSGKECDSVEAKRARVENIITSMRPSPSGLGGDAGSQLSPDMRRPKRKQYQPQQHDSKHTPTTHSSPKYRKVEERDKLKEQLKHLQKTLHQMQRQYDLFDEEDKMAGQSSSRLNKDSKYIDLLSDTLLIKREDTEPCRNVNFNPSGFDANRIIKQATKLVHAQERSNKDCVSVEKEGLKDLASMLKCEIVDAVGSAIDGVVTRFLQTSPKTQKNDNHTSSSTKNVEKENKPAEDMTPRPSEVPTISAAQETDSIRENRASKPPKVHDKPEKFDKYDRFESKPYLDTPMRGFLDMARAHQNHSHLSPYPHLSYYLPSPIHHPPSLMFGVEPEQTEALPLVVSTPKKKRTKVTDTRLSPRAARALLQESVPMSGHSDMQMSRHSPGSYPHVFPMLPTTVAIPNPGLQHSDILRFYEEQRAFQEANHSSTQSPLQADQGSPGASHISASEGAHLSNGKREQDSYSPNEMSYDPSYHMTITLTPMHLRKAKLMFFYVRYPSSAILKMYFPDIKFNKNNTAQLVKWFSNFREFFYIQMEKYSRQAIAEGVKTGEDLVVTLDSELYRVLNLHYNRNNQLDVPESFRMVVQGTLREFFKSIYGGKDTEQSWKKSIYKVIARMDDIIPEYFKSPNWMEQLGEM
uniref:Prospero n=1 Tax=Leptochiton asellus TaxID=211853 RepID=A0A110AID8_9MOLL|nr:prospero [Leptochiton asellus]